MSWNNAIVQPRQFVLFLIAGGAAALVNFGSRFIYSSFTSFSNAVILAYITGMLIAFVLFKFFVFKGSVNSIKKEFVYFVLVNAVAFVQTYIISIGLAEYIFPKVGFTFYPEATAHAIGIAFPTFTSFIGHKYLSFRKR